MNAARSTRHGFNLNRSLRGAGVLSVLLVAGLIASRAATTAPEQIDAGQMADRVLEAKNDGVPANVVRRRGRILAELAKPQDDPWVGTYYEGDGLGENVSLIVGSKSGVAATWFGCMGLYGANEGDVEHIDARTLGFHFKLPNKDSKFGMFPSSVKLVSWDKRRYLVPEARTIDFVNAINRGLEPRHEPHGLFLLADGDDAKPATGLPTLPAEMLAQIRAKPLVVRVRAVEQLAEYDAVGGPVCPFRLHFSLPAGEHVLPGLEFSVEQGDVYETATVEETKDREVLAKMTLWDRCEDLQHKPAVGWVLSSGSVAGEGDASSL